MSKLSVGLVLYTFSLDLQSPTPYSICTSQPTGQRLQAVKSLFSSQLLVQYLKGFEIMAPTGHTYTQIPHISQVEVSIGLWAGAMFA